MLRLIRRHLKSCPHRSSRYRRCSCPLHVYGSLGGERIRRALDQTSWEAASEIVHAWTASGEIGTVRQDAPSVADAVEKFISYAKARNRGWETLRKYDNLLRRRLIPWSEQKGYRHLRQISVDALRTFQTSWTDGPAYAAKNIERTRSFFRFCHQAEWIKTNPALALEAPKARPSPTLPFSAEEVANILAACESYRGDRVRIRAFILVMRFGGLRIGDTIALTRSRIRGNKLFLYTQKTGTPVFVPLPPVVLEALDAIPNSPDRFFWSGRNLRSAVSNWSKYLASVFRSAGVANANSHRFRDTFAVSLLERGLD